MFILALVRSDSADIAAVEPSCRYLMNQRRLFCSMSDRDTRYLNILMNRLERCLDYKPKFGTGSEVTLEDFREMYGEDPLYSWFGMDNPLLYAAQAAGGGYTSLYRQIGLGCEELFREVLKDEYELTDDEAQWSYEEETDSGGTKTLSLDGRIDFGFVEDEQKVEKAREWSERAADRLDIDEGVSQAFNGIVFEVRQGYKSKDSKRQNADIHNIARSISNGYMPVFVCLSTQVDTDIIRRYQQSSGLVLTGSISDSSLHSTYAFCNDVVGYDLAGFFERNKEELQETTEEIFQELLAPADEAGS